MTDYIALGAQLSALIGNVPYETANLSNTSALLWQHLENINWVGFYKLENGKLILGPFQGKPACIEIGIGRGVCGTAVAEDAVQRVADVHQFPGHIACDCASNSEIVLPIHKEGRIWGVLDIDSPVFDRFSSDDESGLRQIVKILEECL
jgi:GAF domain-containing protein